MDLVITGPAFGAGRYGIASSAVCRHVIDSLDVPALTALLSPDNPAVEMYRQNEKFYIIPTTKTIRGIEKALTRLADFAKKVVSREELLVPEVLTEAFIFLRLVVS